MPPERRSSSSPGKPRPMPIPRLSSSGRLSACRSYTAWCGSYLAPIDGCMDWYMGIDPCIITGCTDGDIPIPIDAAADAIASYTMPMPIPTPIAIPRCIPIPIPIPFIPSYACIISYACIPALAGDVPGPSLPLLLSLPGNRREHLRPRAGGGCRRSSPASRSSGASPPWRHGWYTWATRARGGGARRAPLLVLLVVLGSALLEVESPHSLRYLLLSIPRPPYFHRTDTNRRAAHHILHPHVHLLYPTRIVRSAGASARASPVCRVSTCQRMRSVSRIASPPRFALPLTARRPLCIRCHPFPHVGRVDVRGAAAKTQHIACPPVTSDSEMGCDWEPEYAVRARNEYAATSSCHSECPHRTGLGARARAEGREGAAAQRTRNRRTG
ncbi:hypothetical protein DFH09DRAFT_129640 [Mycena vulgaris]|nr:hypothetical protein DFH09DRAFT_129640 [Mycena vulgaris]